jgi:hypothetical protein
MDMLRAGRISVLVCGKDQVSPTTTRRIVNQKQFSSSFLEGVLRLVPPLRMRGVESHHYLAYE